MGLLSFLIPTVDTPFFKTMSNTRRWNNTQLLQLLSGLQLPFGEPKMGWIRAFGKDRQVIVYTHSSPVNYAYVDADGKIAIGMAPKPGQTGGSPKGEEESVSDNECSNVNAVSVLADIIRKLQNGMDLSAYKVEEPVIEEEDEEEDSDYFYMEAESALSLKSRFSIYNADDETVYTVETNVMHNGFKLMDPKGNLLLEIRPKLGLTAEYEIFQNETEIGQLKKKINIFNVEMTGTLLGMPLYVEGSISGMNFDINLGDEIAAKVYAHQHFRSYAKIFHIDIFKEERIRELMALCALCVKFIRTADNQRVSEEEKKWRNI